MVYMSFSIIVLYRDDSQYACTTQSCSNIIHHALHESVAAANYVMSFRREFIKHKN